MVLEHLLLAVDFTFLPNPVDVGFVGSGSSVGALLTGLIAWGQERPAEGIAVQAAYGALGGAVVAFVIWVFGLAGLFSA